MISFYLKTEIIYLSINFVIFLLFLQKDKGKKSGNLKRRKTKRSFKTINVEFNNIPVDA